MSATPLPAPVAEVRVASQREEDGLHMPADAVLSVLALTTLVHYAVLFLACTLGEPLVVGHTDGVSIVVVQPAVIRVLKDSPVAAVRRRVSRTRRLTLLQSAVTMARSLFRNSSAVAIPIGHTHDSAPVILSPVPVLPEPRMVIRSGAQRREMQTTRPGFYFMSFAAVADTEYALFAGTALARACTFLRPLVSIRSALLAGAVVGAAVTFRFGNRDLASVLSSPIAVATGAASLDAVWLEGLTAERRLQDALLAVPDSHPHAAYLHEWGGAVDFLPRDRVPEGKCESLPTFEERAIAQVPFDHSVPIAVTQWVPRSPNQRCPPCPVHTTCAELILHRPDCDGQVDSWFRNATSDFQVLASGAPFVSRRTRTVSLASNCCVPCARCGVLDCRTIRDGYVYPLRFDSPLDLELKTGRLQREFVDYPDQQLASDVLLGAHIGPGMPLRLTLAPQLYSLASGFERVQRELADLAQRGWYALFERFPYFPFHMHPKGCTERKLESDRPRPTTDGSHPHAGQGVVDSCGCPVFSLNYYEKSVGSLSSPTSDAEECHCGEDAPSGFEFDFSCECVCPDAPRLGEVPTEPAGPPEGDGLSPTWWPSHATWKYVRWRRPKEHKWSIASLARDASILKVPSLCSAQPMFGYTDDMRNYFMHFAVRPQDLWKVVVAGFSAPHLAPHISPSRILFVAEYRLGFGLAANSNIAQQFSNFIRHAFMLRMDAADAPFLLEEPPCVQRWLSQRRSLAQRTGRSEARLYTFQIYTDDPYTICVGVTRCLRSLSVWRQLTLDFGLMMAIPEKRRIGTAVKWLGFHPCLHHGLVTVAHEKLLRASTTIDTLLAGRLTVDHYRSLLGFIEHLSFLLPRARLRMAGLYRPLRGGEEIARGPATVVRVDERMQQGWNAWRADLLRVGAAPFTVALPHRRRPPLAGQLTFFISSDASKDGTATPGIAGYMHGFSWQIFYPRCWLRLHITLLEFMALAISIIMFAPLLRHADRVVLETDSLTAAFGLSLDSLQSPFLVEAHALLVETEEYKLLFASPDREVAVRHLTGEANVFADYLSRGYTQPFAELLTHFGVRHSPLQITAAVWEYVEKLMDAIYPLLPCEMHGRGRCPTSTDFDGPSNQWVLAPSSVPVARRAAIAPPPPSRWQTAPQGGPSIGRGGQWFLPRSPPPAPVSIAARPTGAPPLRHTDVSLAAFAVNPPEHLRAAWESTMNELLEASVAPNSLSGEDSAWRSWQEHCHVWGAEPFGGPDSAAALLSPELVNDQLHLAGSYIWNSYFTMKARKKGDIPRPRSAANRYYHVVKRKTRRGRYCPPQKQLTLMLKGMNRRHMAQHGFEAQEVDRKEGFTNAEKEHLQSHLPDGFRMGHFVFLRRSRFGKTWRALIATLNASGFRKAEFAVKKRGDRTHMKFSRLRWWLRGKLYATPPPDLLRDPQAGDYALLYPVPSKCDPDNSTFGNNPIPFRFDPRDSDCAFLCLAELELEVAPASREAPLFADDEGEPFLFSGLDSALRAALLSFLPNTRVQRLSWHSWRIRLACLLKALGPTNGGDSDTIQAALRWKTDQSLRIYARFNRDYYADLLDRAWKNDVRSINVASLPEFGEEQRLLAMHQALESDDLFTEAPAGDTDESKAEAVPVPATGEPVLPAATAPVHRPPPPPTARAKPRPARSGLPPGWQRHDKMTKAGRKYSVYSSATCTTTATSVPHAWRLHEAVPTSTATPRRPTAPAAAAPSQLPPSKRAKLSAKQTDPYNHQCGFPACMVRSSKGRHSGPHQLVDGTIFLS